jgi:hypothetical protein
MDFNLDYTRYFLWAKRSSEYHIDNMLTTVPNKAVIFGPEECDVAYDWGRQNIVPNSIDLMVVTGAANKFNLPHHSIPITAKLILWPTFWMTKTYLDLYHSQVLDDSVIDKLYMSLNVKPRPHRSMLMDELCHHDLLKHGHISWHTNDPDYVWKYWKPTKLIIDTESVNQWTVPSTYKSTLFNLITESSTDVAFVTEKTCTAMFFKKPFLVLGSRGFHRALKDMGFELYDELFDYSFDTDTSLTNRIHGIINNINNLKDQDYELLRHKVKDKVDYNYNKVVELATSRKHVPEFMLQYLDTIKNKPELITPYDLNYIAMEKLLTC